MISILINSGNKLVDCGVNSDSFTQRSLRACIEFCRYVKFDMRCPPKDVEDLVYSKCFKKTKIRDGDDFIW